MGAMASHAPNARKSTTPTTGSHAGVVGSDSKSALFTIVYLVACLARFLRESDGLSGGDRIDMERASRDDSFIGTSLCHL